MHNAIEEQRVALARAFNAKPKDGIQQIMNICQSNNIDNPEQQIAAFFIAEKQNLNLNEVGDYLGTEGVTNKKVLEHFVAGMDFKDQPFPEALRNYLKSYKLPGEAQKIDRLVEEFAKAYVEQNPSSNIANKDAAYILAFQTIMLNTDLHNSAIKNHMTFEQLQRNLKGTNNTANFDEKFLENLYQEIKVKPFELNFVPNPPGFELSSNLLKDDATLKKLSSFMGSPKKSDIGDVFPNLKGNSNITVELDKPKPFLSNFRGYEGTITITDQETGAKASVQVYKPSFFSRLLFGEKPSVIIQPIGEEGKAPNTKSVELAAHLAASFKAPVKSFKATYDYEVGDLIDAFDKAKGGKTVTATRDEAREEVSGSKNQQVQTDTPSPVKPRTDIRGEKVRGFVEKIEGEKPEIDKSSPPKQKHIEGAESGSLAAKKNLWEERTQAITPKGGGRSQ